SKCEAPSTGEEGAYDWLVNKQPGVCRRGPRHRRAVTLLRCALTLTFTCWTNWILSKAVLTIANPQPTRLPLQEVHLGVFGRRVREANTDTDEAHRFSRAGKCFR